MIPIPSGFRVPRPEVGPLAAIAITHGFAIHVNLLVDGMADILIGPVHSVVAQIHPGGRVTLFSLVHYYREGIAQ